MPDAQKFPRNWYVAIVRSNTEKAVVERLEKQGIEAYVATQSIWRQWRNGRRKLIDRVVLRTLVFIHITEKERREIVKLPYILRFMVNRAASRSGALTNPLAIISQREIDTLRFMLGQSDTPVDIIDTPYRRGDKVKVIRGNLAGLEGEILTDAEGAKRLIIRLDHLGAARLEIPAHDLAPL